MTSKTSNMENLTKADPIDAGSADACQKYGNIWLCGDYEEVKKVISLLKEKQENRSESSSDETAEKANRSTNDEPDEDDEVEDD
ncbi:MAG TPA: hypothetical protein VMC42_09030 [Methanoregulaceae archaeon]|nr:hypothetical protein [Methanoregulaceae archaeon]